MFSSTPVSSRRLLTIAIFVVGITLPTTTAFAQQSSSVPPYGPSPAFLARRPNMDWPPSSSTSTSNRRTPGMKSGSLKTPNSGNPILAPEVSYDTGGGGAGGLVVGDVNGDGKPDVVVLTSATLPNGDGPVSVLLGNGDGTFQPPVIYDAGGGGSSSVAIADVNGDGKPDLVVSNACQPVNGSCFSGVSGSVVGVLLGNGDGTFRAPLTYFSGGYGPLQVVVADFNGDGKPDLAVLSNCLTSGNCSGDGAISVLLGNGDGTFNTPSIFDSGGWAPVSLFAADVNGDGIPDLVAANNCGAIANPSCTDGTVEVLLGNGDGTFQNGLRYDSGLRYVNSTLLVDVNGDGKLDVVCLSILLGNLDSGWVSVLTNNGGGSFTLSQILYAGSVWPLSFAVADLNHDGAPDIVTDGYASDTVGILLNDGTGNFHLFGSDSTGAVGVGDNSYVTIADINGDGNPDIIVTNNPCIVSCPSQVGVLLGHGDGNFEPVQLFPTGGGVTQVTTTDLRGDGKPDVLAWSQVGGVNNDGVVSVLLNNTIRPFNPSTTTLVPSANPLSPKQTVTYTATVTSQRAEPLTGTMTFTDRNLNCTEGNTNVSCLVATTAALSGNQATYVTSYPNANDRHQVTAAYSGDADNGFSTSAPLIEFIASLPIGSNTALITSGTPSLVGQPVTLTATVTWKFGTVPNGEAVSFYDGTTLIGSGTTTGGQASLTTSSLTKMLHVLKAAYGGDASFKASSGTTRQVVNGYPTATSPSSNLNPSIYGQTVTFTATVTTVGTAAPTGAVDFIWSGHSLGIAALDATGTARLTRSRLNADSYPVIAVYLGDASNAGSSSAVLSQLVQPTTSSATITSSMNPSSRGQAVTFTATISSPTVVPTGLVTFAAGKSVLGTVQLSGGKAKLTTSSLPSGSTTVTVTFAGDSNITSSSASVNQVVQ